MATARKVAQSRLSGFYGELLGLMENLALKGRFRANGLYGFYGGLIGFYERVFGFNEFFAHKTNKPRKSKAQTPFLSHCANKPRNPESIRQTYFAGQIKIILAIALSDAIL